MSLGRASQGQTRHIGRSEEANTMWTSHTFRYVDQMTLSLHQAVVKLAAISADSFCRIVYSWKDHLSTVGVPTDLEIDSHVFILTNNLGNIGIMGKQYPWSFRIDVLEGLSQVDFVFPKVSGTADDEQLAFSVAPAAA